MKYLPYLIVLTLLGSKSVSAQGYLGKKNYLSTDVYADATQQVVNIDYMYNYKRNKGLLLGYKGYFGKEVMYEDFQYNATVSAIANWYNYNFRFDLRDTIGVCYRNMHSFEIGYGHQFQFINLALPVGYYLVYSFEYSLGTLDEEVTVFNFDPNGNSYLSTERKNNRLNAFALKLTYGRGFCLRNNIIIDPQLETGFRYFTMDRKPTYRIYPQSTMFLRGSDSNLELIFLPKLKIGYIF